MKRDIPKWAPLSLTIVGSAGLFVLTLVPRVQGVTKWVLIGLSILFVIAGPVGTELAGRLAAQATRLRLTLAFDPPLTAIPPFDASDSLVDARIESERDSCLKSLRPARAEEHKHKTIDVTRLGGGPSLGDVQEYERRESAGESLAPEEKDALDEYRRKAAEIRRTISAASNSFVFGSRDTRSEQDYRDEVELYLSMYREALEGRVTQAYVAKHAGLLRLILSNPTERTFEGVQVEVTIPGGVWASDNRAAKKEDLPHRPLPFGARRSYLGAVGLGTTFDPALLRLGTPGISRPRPLIENSTPLYVKYPPVTLRAGGRERLDDIHLFTSEPPGSALNGSWEATATNGTGRVRGAFQLVVGMASDFTPIFDDATNLE